MGLFDWLFGKKDQQEDTEMLKFRHVILRSNSQPLPTREKHSPQLKPYLTRLCKVHATNGDFASPETRAIGEELYSKFGHTGMVTVCDAVSAQLGSGPGRDLEYKWDGIGEWRG